MVRMNKEFTAAVQHLIDDARAYLISGGLPANVADELDDVSVIGYAAAIREKLQPSI